MVTAGGALGSTGGALQPHPSHAANSQLDRRIMVGGDRR